MLWHDCLIKDCVIEEKSSVNRPRKDKKRRWQQLCKGLILSLSACSVERKPNDWSEGGLSDCRDNRLKTVKQSHPMRGKRTNWASQHMPCRKIQSLYQLYYLFQVPPFTCHFPARAISPFICHQPADDDYISVHKKRSICGWLTRRGSTVESL